MRRVLTYGSPALSVILLAALILSYRDVDVMKIFDSVMPVINFAVLVTLLFASRGWTGPSQHHELAELKETQRIHALRLDSVERNTRHLYEDWARSLDALRGELHALSGSIARMGDIANRTTSTEERMADVEQKLQFVDDLGCGHPACPRFARPENNPGGGNTPPAGKE